jgi:filamentous hemagglutinin
MKTPQAQAIIDSYMTAGLSQDDAFRYAGNLINTGSNLPQSMVANQNTELIKVVPKGIPNGDTVGNYSPFFMTREQYNALSSVPVDQIANRLGLPAEQAIRGSQLGFDVYSMKPVPGSNPTVFTSQVAPVQQGAYSASGGAQQVLVPNRSQWTDPNASKIGEIRGSR